MKPRAFEYVGPTNLPDALDALATREDAKVLAGGQSLVPAMNFRLATPATLVDVNRIPDRNQVEEAGGRLRVGMLARHAALERVAIDDPLGSLIATISRYVGHLPIRVRGTLAGSLAHADPAAEWCALAVALDATIIAASVRGERAIPASEFFQGLFTTALAADEIIVEVGFPLLRRAGWGFHEQSRTAGDFATVAAVAVLDIDNGRVQKARVGLAGVEPAPVTPSEAIDVLQGNPATDDLLEEAAATAARNVDAVSDANYSAEYRTQLVQVLVLRALADARSRTA
jgi:carbon-monoxide dehydrogenase medium subunit